QKADCTERWLRFTSREVAHYYFAPNTPSTAPL
ncbi:capsule biosynthesis protein, partial [Burkholderia sp. Bp9125]